VIESADGETCMLRQRYSETMLRPGEYGFGTVGDGTGGLRDGCGGAVDRSGWAAVTTNLNNQLPAPGCVAGLAGRGPIEIG